MHVLPQALPFVQMRQHLIGGVHDVGIGAGSEIASSADALNVTDIVAMEIATTKAFSATVRIARG